MISQVAVKVMRTNLTGGQKETEIKVPSCALLMPPCSLIDHRPQIICRELKVWVKLEHECVLPLYGISFDFGRFPAMVCPWLEGGTLGKYIESHEDLPLHTRLQLVSDILDLHV